MMLVLNSRLGFVRVSGDLMMMEWDNVVKLEKVEVDCPEVRMFGPVSVTMYQNNTMIVADKLGGRILKITPPFGMPVFDITSCASYSSGYPSTISGVNNINSNLLYSSESFQGAKGRLNYYVSSESGGEFTASRFTQFHSTPNITFGDTMQVTYDYKNKLLYAADANNHRIQQFDVTHYADAVLLKTYGQTQYFDSAPNLGQSAPSSMTLLYPSQIALGCDSDDIWVADTNNNRILHYPSGSGKTADSVIGQPDFHTNTTGNDSKSLNQPRGVVLNADCSSMWVADTMNQRILQFSLSTGFPFMGIDATSQHLINSSLYPYGLAIDLRKFINNNNYIIGIVVLN